MGRFVVFSSFVDFNKTLQTSISFNYSKYCLETILWILNDVKKNLIELKFSFSIKFVKKTHLKWVSQTGHWNCSLQKCSYPAIVFARANLAEIAIVWDFIHTRAPAKFSIEWQRPQS